MASSENEFDLAISYDLERVFVWLPTGFGKSICYRYTTLPFVFDHKLGRVDRDYHSLVVVVSPLISLIIEQVASLKAIESSASIATSGVPTIFDGSGYPRLLLEGVYLRLYLLPKRVW